MEVPISPIEIRNIRKRMNLTQSQFAQLIGVHSMTVSRWERPDAKAKPNNYQIQQLRMLDQGADTMNEDGWTQFQQLFAMGLFVGALALVVAAAVRANQRGR